MDRLGKLKPVIIDRYYAKVEADKKAAAEGAAAQKAAAAAAKAQQDAASAAAQKAGAAAKAAATSSAGARAGGGSLSDSFANLRVAKPRSGGPTYKPQGKAYPTVPTSFATYVVLGVSMPATVCSFLPPLSQPTAALLLRQRLLVPRLVSVRHALACRGRWAPASCAAFSSQLT